MAEIFNCINLLFLIYIFETKICHNKQKYFYQIFVKNIFFIIAVGLQSDFTSHSH